MATKASSDASREHLSLDSVPERKERSLRHIWGTF